MYDTHSCSMDIGNSLQQHATGVVPELLEPTLSVNFSFVQLLMVIILLLATVLAGDGISYN